MDTCRQETRVKRRASRALTSFNDTRKGEARQAILAIAGNNGIIFTKPKAIGESFSKAPTIAALPPLRSIPERGNADLISLNSHERAMIRGSHRGSFEFNERTDFENRSLALSEDSLNRHSLDFEHSTMAATQTTMQSFPDSEAKAHAKKVGKAKRGLNFFIKRGSSQSNSKQSSSKKDKKEKKPKPIFVKKSRNTTFLTSEIHSPEAWMCGVCAKTFSSMDAANKHEEYHIKEVVLDLGWVTHTGLEDENSMALDADPYTMDQPFTPLQANDGRRVAFATQATPSTPSSALEPRPDILTKSMRKLGNHGKVSFLEKEMSQLPASRPFDFQDSPRRNFLSSSPFPKKPCIRNLGHDEDPFDEPERFLVPHGMKDFVVLADEGLIDCCHKAAPMILNQDEKRAEEELGWLSNDKRHFDLLAERHIERVSRDRYHKLRKEGKTVAERIQNKFVDAYQLMKEGNAKSKAVLIDHYNRKPKGEDAIEVVMEHSSKTMYVNVVVKNSVRVVSHELERLAKQRWEEQQQPGGNKAVSKKKLGIGTDAQAANFQRFRAAAQGNLVKLAGLALASDFTPRRIAVQLSNDVYRHFPPRLKRHGITIESEIEYRVGPFFVLAVNITNIDWHKFIRYTHRDIVEREKQWQREKERELIAEGCDANRGQRSVVVSCVRTLLRCGKMSKYEVLAQCIGYMYYLHWTIYLPICWITYHFLFGNMYRTHMLQSVADETFVLVEEKGMEMQVGIRQAKKQAAFMLSALREIREDGRQLKKKQKETQSADKGTLLGPLLGPAIKSDKDPAPPIPEGFELPASLEFIGLELDLPVGFRRLRWALLHSECTFMPEAVFRTEAKYDNITIGSWSKHNEAIGSPVTPDEVKEEDFIGAERVSSYLMPRSAFVKANVCTETASIEAYNDYCFVLKKKALNPDVPYGSTFVAWTKYIVINTGNDTCKMICSVEAEFPNGPPMIARQIKSGMRAGVGELFVLTGETISKYADEY